MKPTEVIGKKNPRKLSWLTAQQLHPFFGTAVLIIMRYFYQNKAEAQAKRKAVLVQEMLFDAVALAPLLFFQIAERNKTNPDTSGVHL